MLIWMEAWSLAPMILLLAELEKYKMFHFPVVWTYFTGAWRGESNSQVTNVCFPQSWEPMLKCKYPLDPCHLALYIIGTHHLRGT